MPYSPPSYSSGRSSSPSFSHHSRSVSPHSHQNQNQNQNPSHSLGRPGHRRSYSSQSQFGFGSGSGSSPRSASPSSNTRFSNEWSPNGNVNGGAWSGLGALPRRHSSAPPTSKFHIGDRRGGGSSSEEEDHDSALPPLKLKVQVLPSFSQGVPFPKTSSDSPVQNGPIPIPLPPTVPSNVTMTRSSNPALARTASSPAVTQPSSTANSPAGVPAVILLSTGKPLRSSLKGSRASSVLGSPIGSAAPSPSTSPRPSPDHSATNSVVGSPMTSPLIDGMPAPSFGSLASFGGPDSNSNSNYLLAPPSASASVLFSGHVRAQSAPSHPSGSDAYPSPAATPLGPLSPSLSECAALMSPGGTLLSPRNVHFPSLSSDLEHVKLFRKEARPSSLLITRKELTNNVHSNRSVNGVEGTEAEADGAGSGNGGEETETETETDRDYGYGYRSYWGSGTWGGKGLWNAAAPSKTSPGTKNQIQPDRFSERVVVPVPTSP
ncbi:hypothetical protein BT96DRAFT_995772 [Gymnopus androsaceus JB14]|uniref:Uncharacterized protein n=1 Tax=Gymnopus androsaceus JB14 TaxID=1447944 RepID=A0A6A4HK16_9AGAR|nr:hypothetical protein BT96DRAFT_995772 [Gymnopus androsaceus JB14]